MTTPTFFAYDNFQSYAVGSISVLGDGVVWAAPGGVVANPITYVLDNLESYAVGAVNSLTGGVYWTGDATFNHYNNS